MTQQRSAAWASSLVAAACLLLALGCGGGGGGGACALGGRACAAGASCCNGQTTVRDSNGICSCSYVDGQVCWAGSNVSPFKGSQECCNPPAGSAGIGVVRSPCATTTSGTCTTDADCFVATACITWGAERICQGACSGGGSTPTLAVPCCDGFVVSTFSAIAGMCALAPGRLCNYNLECASGTCVPGTTTATCL